MTQEQIEPIIQKEKTDGESAINKQKAAFYNAVYEGKEIPKDFVSLFGTALFSLAPMSDNIASKALEGWLQKKNEELNFGEVMKMTEIIASVPRFSMFESMKEANEKLYAIEMIMFDIREKNQVFTHEMENKMQELKQHLNKRRFELQNQPGKVKGQKEKKNKRALEAV